MKKIKEINNFLNMTEEILKDDSISKVDRFKKVLGKATDPKLKKHLEEKIRLLEGNKTVLK